MIAEPLQIILKRESKTYLPDEMVRGIVRITSPEGPMSHSGIKLQVVGTVVFQLNSKTVGIFEALYNTIKPLTIMDIPISLTTGGKFPEGVTDIPFEFKMQKTGNYPLYETYHGVFINVQYKIHCTMSRGMFSREVKKSTEFICNVPGQGAKYESQNTTPVIEFQMKPKSLTNIKKSLVGSLPDFSISGKLQTARFNIATAFSGEMTVESTQIPIKSIELQLVRVETLESSVKEATEIQNLQIGEGDPLKKISIPLYMIFPRLFTCATILTQEFRVEFEINLIILFTDGHQVTENFPIILYRE